MKNRTLRRLVPAAMVMLMVAGCNDDALERKVTDLELRVARLERERRTPIGKSEPQAGPEASAAAVHTSTSMMPSQSATSVAVPVAPSQQEARPVIEQHCKSKWPTDFEMQAHCMKEQREAVEKLNASAPADVPGEAFTTIRTHCQQKWPTDFEMREYCERQQVTGYRQAQQ